MHFDISISICIFSSIRTYNHLIKKQQKWKDVLQGDIFIWVIGQFHAWAGKQHVSSSIVAIMYSSLVHPNFWTSDEIDYILEPGDTLYNSIYNCARAQLISQHVDAGQLNVLPQQRPITLSLTKVMLDWIPDKLAHNASSQSELWEARQAIPGFK